MEPFERVLSQDKIYTGRIFEVSNYKVELTDGRKTRREVVAHHGGACVVALNDAGELLLERQYRFAADRVLWELPAGKLEPGEEPMAAAARELEEETGYAADRLTLMTAMLPTPAYSTEVIYIYRAQGLRESRQHLDEDECLSVEWVPFARALDMVLCGEIADAKTQVGILQAAALGWGRPGAHHE